MEASDLKRMKELEDENNRLKKMYADMALENRAIKGSSGKVITPDRRRWAVEFLIGIWSLSITRACAIAGLKEFDMAIMITNDSDLLEPMRIVREELGLPVGIINPQKKAELPIAIQS